MENNSATKRTSLHAKHLALKAKMAPFAGYDMPIQYTSVKDETLAVRQSVGVFDVSHMGEFFVEGPEAHAFIDSIITNDFLGAGANKAVYSPLCREDGTVIDDLIAYKLSPERALICVNASNIQKDWDWISSKHKGFNCKLSNKSEDYSLLALQGPKTTEIMSKLELLPHGEFPYYSVSEAKHQGETVILARTGYTGEDGFEIFCSHTKAAQLWDKMLSIGVTPCGLAARDVLRLEVCYPLYGHELNDHLTPLDAGLKWTVKFARPKFIGREALQNLKPKYKLVKLLVDKGIPRQGYPVLNSQGEVIGEVTSGTLSVTINQGICLALVESARYPGDDKFLINIRNKNYEATPKTKAFVTGGHK